MKNIQEKTIALLAVTIMTILVLSYLIFNTVSLVLLINELSNEEDEKQNITIVVYNINEVEEKETTKSVKPAVTKKEPVKETVKESVAKDVKRKEVKQVVKKENINSDEKYLLAQIINAEAKGEPYNGKVAVGNVVINRVNHPSFPDTIKDVIFQKGQFHPVSNGSIYNKPSDEALKAAEDALNGKQIVGTQALYFYNPKTSTSDWIFSRKTIIDIGNHRFAY